LPSPPNNPDEALEWTKVIVAAIGGGVVVKVLDILYQEIRRQLDKRQTSTSFVDQHLDPLLKAADELVGKLLSLGREDFRSLADVDGMAPYLHSDFGSTTYLFARFWGQIEILRQQALYVSISAEERGRQLQAFLDCLESRGVRLLDRISQRAVGETLLGESGTTTVRYVEFAKSLDDPLTARWLKPLADLLAKASYTTQRQQLLQYGIVLHAMIDTLDPSHSVTHDRPSIPNKLSRHTWRELNYRVFRTYLNFVASPEKYIGRPKRRAADSSRSG
jgi:hypothetical protein